MSGLDSDVTPSSVSRRAKIFMIRHRSIGEKIDRSGRSNARSARVVNPRRPPSASCSTSFGAGLVRHRRASMANYVITRALLKRIEADSTRAAQPDAAVHWIYEGIEHLETRCTRASRARGHRANCVRRLWYCRPARRHRRASRAIYVLTRQNAQNDLRTWQVRTIFSGCLTSSSLFAVR